MQHNALILHGWPQTELNQHILVKYLEKNGYKVIVPNLYNFDYTDNTVIRDISNSVDLYLKGEKLDLIVGISMGGLIVPVIAHRFPEAKLIFIASAPKFLPDFYFMRFMLSLIKFRFVGKSFVGICNLLPKKGIEIIYRKLNPFSGKPEHRRLYETDTESNLKVIGSYPFSKHMEMLEFISSIDNTVLLGKITNKTLVFAGSEDKLMPYRESKRLVDMMKSSQLVATGGMHFNVLTKNNIKDIDKFLRN